MLIHKLKPEQLEPAVRNSLVALRLEYGDVFETQDHIRPYFDFGVVPADYLSRRGWVWFEAGPLPLPRGFLRSMRELFAVFVEKEGWDLVAHFEIEDEAAARFGRFFGFREFARTDQFIYARIF